METVMKTVLITLALALGTVAAAGPASAEPAALARVAVSTAGLDLTTDKGLRALDLRILHAASEACGTPSPADPRGRVAYEDCRYAARAAAVTQRDRVLQAARDRGVVEIAFKR
jgi:UrcA family protein